MPANAAIPASRLEKVVVVGTSGAGKSTFARKLAQRLALPHIELDLLYWLRNWTPRDTPDFQRRVNEATAGRSWVIDGNYSAVRDLVWPKATAIVWLDYSFSIVFWRALRRTVTRIVARETICNGNRETVRRAFLSRYGIPWWVVRTYRRRAREYPALLAAAEHAHLSVIVLKRPCDAGQFLDNLPQRPDPPTG